MFNVCVSINIPEQFLAFIESSKLQKTHHISTSANLAQPDCTSVF